MGYREEIQAANKQGKSLEERWKLRAAVREKYGMGPEKRQRGGIAGVYDRNKEVIKPVAQLAAGMTPLGWAGGAIAGAAMGGLDREGRGGIGFDVGGAVRGGAQGAAMGALGQYGKGAVQEFLAKRAGGQAVAGAAQAGVPQAGSAAAQAAKPSLANRVGGFMKNNPMAVGMGLQAGATAMDANAQRTIAGQNQQLGSRQLEFEEKRYQDELAAKQRRSQLAQQLYEQIMGQMSWRRGG